MAKLRVTVSNRFAIIGLMLLMATSLAACKADSNYFATSNASIGSTDGSSSDSAAGFRVRIKPKAGVDSLLHKFGDISAACEVPLATVTAGTPTSIQCMLNMMEYDLWFYGYEWEFNVPKDACKFVNIIPNYHYVLQPGQGISTATINTTEGLMQSCTVDGVAGVVAGGNCVGVEGTISPTGGATCIYNYTGSSPRLPNCCTGEANVLLNATTTAAGVSTTTSSVIKTAFGGNYGNCLESPHDYIDSWPKFTAAGLTGTHAYYYIAETGGSALVKSQKIPSSGSLQLLTKRPISFGNFLNAGFHDWTKYSADATTWDTARTVPRAFQPIADNGPLNDHLITGAATTATSVGRASDGGEDFRCLGAAGEIKFRIRLYVNEWNTIEDYTAYKASGVASGANPTVTGVSGVNCSAVNIGPSCNSLWGYDDMLNNAGAGPGGYSFPLNYEGSAPP